MTLISDHPKLINIHRKPNTQYNLNHRLLKTRLDLDDNKITGTGPQA